MQSILKKTLIAAAIAGVTSANAAVVTGTTSTVDVDKDWQLVSAEGLAIAETINVGTGAGEIPVQVETEANYQETDLLIVTITGATIDEGSSAAFDGALANFELLGVDSEAGTITFRPTQGLTPAGVAAGTGNLTGVTLTDLSGAVTVATRGVTVQGINIDAGKATPVAEAVSEFGFAAGDKLDAVIDVEKERKEFVSGTTDNFDIDITSGADLLEVTVTGSQLALTGSATLSFLNDADGELDSASYSLDGATESEAELEGNTLTVTAGAPGASIGMTLTADGMADEDAQQLMAQSFTAAAGLNYSLGGTAGTVSSGDLSVGAWALSGASVNMPYMPFGSGISQVVYLSNDGGVNGDIELTAFDDAGNSYGPVKLDVTATPNAVTQLSRSIRVALAEEGFDGQGKIDMTLVVNSPAGDVDVYGAYNVRGDRVTVPVIKL